MTEKKSALSDISSFLFAGTSDGVWAVPLFESGEPQHVTLSKTLVNTVTCASDGSLAIAVPKFGPLHEYFGFREELIDNGEEKAGLYTITNEQPLQKIVRGDARTCTFVPREFVRDVSHSIIAGFEPASLWYHQLSPGCVPTRIDRFDELSSRSSWTFALSPHQPHVTTIEFQGDAIVAGMEVGGVAFTRDAGASWEEANEGLPMDVHAVKPDPYNSSLYATTGEGLYRCDNIGDPWKQVQIGHGAGYTVGLAFSESRANEMMITCAQRPPERGSGCVLHSCDAGLSWKDITPVGACMDRAPVPYFAAERIFLATADGSLYSRPDTESGQNAEWSVLAHLPGSPYITSLAVGGYPPVSVMH